MKMFFAVFFFFGSVPGMSLPEPGVTPDNAVPFATVKGLALRKAAAEWPGCRLGTVVPYVDENGQTVAYMFHFRTDGKEFPDYQQVVSDILAEREGLTVNTDLTRWRSKYSHLLISARYDRTPIFCYGYGTSEFYAVAPEGLRRARAVLGQGARLSRIYFVAPRTFLEFANPAGEVVIFTPHFERVWGSQQELVEFIRTRQAAAGITGAEQQTAAAHHRQEWERALTADFSNWNEVYVPEAGKAPFYDWSYGCTPTAAAMVLGYIDRTQNYGRLVDWFWQRWDMVEGEWDKQIPNVQRECALNMYTDTTSGGTYIGAIAQGLYLVGYENGYNFEMVEDLGHSGNDWAWNTIVQEIDGGYAFVWSAIWAIHSLAAYGYRTPEKDLFVHNTWWQPAEWWHYSGNGNSHVASPHPIGGDVHKLELLYPRGDTFYNSIGRGETLQVGDTVMVRWDNFGNPAHQVAIDISFNAGKTWSLLDSVPDTGEFPWFINPALTPCESVRLRLRQYYNGELTAADGSFGCFRLVREPLPPALLSPRGGQQLFAPPVVLIADTNRHDIDSFCFRLIYGIGDTLWRETKTTARCTIPDSIFTYNRSYKWVCKGRNRFGWGEFGNFADFRIRFNPGVAEENGFTVGEIKSPTVRVRHSAGLELRGDAGGQLAIYDATGKVVRSFSLPGSGVVFWDFRGENGVRIPAGLYFIRVFGTGGKLHPTDSGVQKLIVVD